MLLSLLLHSIWILLFLQCIEATFLSVYSCWFYTMTSRGIWSCLPSLVQQDIFFLCTASGVLSPQQSNVTSHRYVLPVCWEKCYIALPPRGKKADEHHSLCVCTTAGLTSESAFPLLEVAEERTHDSPFDGFCSCLKNAAVLVEKDKGNTLQIESIT